MIVVGSSIGFVDFMLMPFETNWNDEDVVNENDNEPDLDVELRSWIKLGPSLIIVSQTYALQYIESRIILPLNRFSNEYYIPHLLLVYFQTSKI